MKYPTCFSAKNDTKFNLIHRKNKKKQNSLYTVFHLQLKRGKISVRFQIPYKGDPQLIIQLFRLTNFQF